MASRLGRVVRIASTVHSTKLDNGSRLRGRNIVITRDFHNTHRRLTPTPSPSKQSTLLPEFSLKNRVIVVSGGGRGLGLVQCEALLEAGAVVHAIDRLPAPTADSEFAAVANRAENELGTSFTYHRLDVRDNALLNDTVAGISEKHGRIDGLIAAAGIQQETPALEYSQEDSDKMMGVNITGVFMTAQAVARQMIKRKQGGSLVLIASMSGTVANRGLICP
jgi:NAD(P)-dependent dehydrogenase (short-subunit alcohol dehydrogenase family)